MARETRDGVVYDEIDGVRAVWPEGRRSGEPQAALSFRVGQADETLQTRGITHLVEHLALVKTGQAPHAYNGRTGPTITTFGMQGTPEDLVGFFATLGESLGELPLDRLDLERGVLATEERGGGGDVDNLFRLRWGPRGYGLMGYVEYGAQRAHGQTLQEWSSRWFTKQNALLVLNGPPPRGLRVPLPDGAWCAPPEPGPAIDPLPMSFDMHGEWFGLSLLRERQAGGNEGSWLMSERLNQRLRFQLGLVYGVQGGSSAYTPTWRHDIYWTHALPDKLSAAGGALVDVLAEIAAPMTDAERAQWKALRSRAADQRTSREARLAYAYYAAEELLLGGTVQTKDQLAEIGDALTEADLLATIEQSLTRMVLAIPEGVDTSRVATALAQHSSSALTGRTIAPAHAQKEELVLAPEGVTLLQLPARKPVTVRFDDLAGVLSWDDGSRTLLSNDGFAVAYRPEMWHAKAGDVISHIDTRVDPSLVIGQGSRTPVERPAGVKAPSTSSAPAFSELSGSSKGWFLARCVLAFIWIVSGIGSVASPDPTQTTAENVFTTLVLLVLGSVVGFQPVRWAWRRYRGRSKG